MFHSSPRRVLSTLPEWAQAVAVLDISGLRRRALLAVQVGGLGAGVGVWGALGRLRGLWVCGGLGGLWGFGGLGGFRWGLGGV